MLNGLYDKSSYFVVFRPQRVTIKATTFCLSKTADYSAWFIKYSMNLMKKWKY